MKSVKMLLLVMVFLLNSLLFSVVVDSEQSLKIAQNKLKQLSEINYSVANDRNTIKDEKGNILSYIYTLIPQGYIVVSADTNLPPVIAYSFTSNFYEESSGNILENFVKNDVSLRLKNIPNLPKSMLTERNQAWEELMNNTRSKDRFEQWPPTGTTPTGGWLWENWSQNAPYNSLCPMDLNTGSRSVAGCPSIAMAQILNYHRTVNQVVFDDDEDDYYHNFAGNYYWIDDDYLEYDFPPFMELNTYLDTLSHHYLYNIPLTNIDKGAITFACGVAAQQVYSSTVSGTFGVGQAYQAYQKFNFEDVVLTDDSDDNFYQQISQNIIDAFPVHFASITVSEDAGHNFVIDGYNTDEYFHLNMGWGGSYNGWYLLPDETPYGLTVVEGAIYDIEPILQPNGFIMGEVSLTGAESDTLNIVITASTPTASYSIEILPDMSGTTDFVLEVPIGMYDVTAAYPGYETSVVENVFVEAYQFTTVNFSLLQIIAPTDLAAELIDHEVFLNWDHPDSRTFQYFKIYRKINTSPFALLDTTSYDEYVDFVDPPISLTYGYYVKAVYSQDNESEPSNEVYVEYEVSIDDNSVNPTVNSLYNYPNPFNPETTISFLATKSTKDTKINIYNLKGQKIRELRITNCELGINSVVWDGKDDKNKAVSSGIYFYKLQTESYEKIKRMILMK
ncbi:MAG: C10 family peptidase [Candidatus Cloacimonetes bacterium]|nr:C10 family peptidase [Candidatus Cloacimonadota bacterium]